MVFLNRMFKGQGKAFAKAWLTKLEDEHVADANKNWIKIKKALKATFILYEIAVQAQVVLILLNENWKNSSGFNKYISSFSLLSIHSRITNYHVLSEWFFCGLDPYIKVQLTLCEAINAFTTMEELYSKAFEIKRSYHHITMLRRVLQLPLFFPFFTYAFYSYRT